MAALLPIAICMLGCPLLMFIMMKGKGSTGEAKPDRAPKPARVRLSREDQLAALKTRLASSQAERETLQRELDLVESSPPPAARDAEPGVQAKAEH